MSKEVIRQRIGSLLASSILAAAVSSVYADDTDVFTGRGISDPEVQTNALIVFDTSGSMLAEKDVPDLYDKSIAYPGCFTGNRIYYVRNGVQNLSGLDCGTQQFFTNVTHLKCQRAFQAVNTTGFFVDRFVRRALDGVAWQADLSAASMQIDTAVECRSDRGLHGENAASAEKYVNDSPSGTSDGWFASSSPNPAGQRLWNLTDRATSNTLATGNYLNYLEGVNSGTGAMTSISRLEIAKRALETVVDSVGGVNLGLMRMTGWQCTDAGPDGVLDSTNPAGNVLTHVTGDDVYNAGRVLVDISNLDVLANRNSFKDKIREGEGLVLPGGPYLVSQVGPLDGGPYGGYLFHRDARPATDNFKFFGFSATNPAGVPAGSAVFNPPHYASYIPSNEPITAMPDTLKNLVTAGHIKPAAVFGCELLPATAVPNAAARSNFFLEPTPVSNQADYQRWALPPLGRTPLTEVLWEARNYMIGGPAQNPVHAAEAASIRKPGNAEYTGEITQECGSNIVVVMSDGQESNTRKDETTGFVLRHRRNAYYRDTVDKGIEDYITSTGNPVPVRGETYFDNLPAYMHALDQNPTLPGEQSIETYTVGFNLSSAVLRRAAIRGGGQYYQASDPIALTQAFTDILSQVSDVPGNFTAASLSLGQFNRSALDDDIFFTMFQPSDKQSWEGNFKKYQIAFDPVTGPEIQDRNGSAAINTATGQLKASAASFWHGDVDGNDPLRGGVASQLGDNRRVFTDLHGNDIAGNPNNRLRETNAAITSTDLGLIGGPTAEPLRDSILRWARGEDAFDRDGDSVLSEPHESMGAPLHSRPLTLNYGSSGASPTAPDRKYAFVTTTHGFLHVFDISQENNITELVSYMPQDLLPELQRITSNAVKSAGTPLVYGLDGPMSVWVYDDANDGKIDASDDHVYLFMTQRRGGRNIYGLDVTDPARPRVLPGFPILGGQGDFTELGQTWSRPEVRFIEYEGDRLPVLIVGGGYDPSLDSLGRWVYEANQTQPGSLVQGRGVYIISLADTSSGTVSMGDRLWWLGPNDPNFLAGNRPDVEHPEFLHSVPSNVLPVDVDSDGDIDFIYVLDSGGGLWRVDLNRNHVLGQPVHQRVSLLARVGDWDIGASPADIRQTFHSLDAAIITEPGQAPVIAVSFGSGERPNPLSDIIKNHFYMFKDPHVFSVPGPSEAAYDKHFSDFFNALDFFDASSGELADGATYTTALQNLRASSGWYLPLDTGEKILARPIIVNGVVTVTSYTPNMTPSSCEPDGGVSRLYKINITTGTPAFNLDTTNNEITRDDYSVSLAHQGIIDESVVVLTEDGLGIATGLQLDSAQLSRKFSKTYWYEKQQ